MPPPRTILSIQELWPKLEATIEKILELGKLREENFSMAEYMEALNSVYNYCTSQRSSSSIKGASVGGEELHIRYSEFIKRKMEGLVLQIKHLYGEAMLKFYVEEWDRFTRGIRTVDHLFRYLNNHWVKRESESNPNVRPIAALSMYEWNNLLLNVIRKRLHKATLHLIECERNGDHVDFELIKRILHSFRFLAQELKDSLKDPYENFVRVLIRNTREYYSKEANEFSSNNSVSDYMKKVEVRVEEENQRASKCLKEVDRAHVVHTCLSSLINNHQNFIINELMNFFVDGKFDDLQRSFSLLSRASNLVDNSRASKSVDNFLAVFEKYSLNEGLRHIEMNVQEASNDAGVYVNVLVSVILKLKAIVEDIFEKGKPFKDVLKKACRKFVNTNAVTQHSSLSSLGSPNNPAIHTANRESDNGSNSNSNSSTGNNNSSKMPLASSSARSAELLAKHVNELLSKSCKLASEEEIEAKLKDAIKVFKYLDSRDAFLQFYAKHLCSRLIGFSSGSEQLEAFVITLIQNICGAQEVSKFKKMINDMQLSASLVDEFKRTRSSQISSSNSSNLTSSFSSPLSKTEFHFSVLTSNSWPIKLNNTEIIVPGDIQQNLDLFKEVYVSTRSGRCLTWVHHLSKGDVQSMGFAACKQLRSPIIVSCNTYQAAVLLAFNSPCIERITTFKVLQTVVGLNDQNLRNVLFTLLKSRLLVCDPKFVATEPITQITENHKIAINFKNYPGKKARVILTSKLLSEEEKETNEGNEDLIKLRKTLLEAAIVRIMKTRQTLDHQMLVTTCIDHLKSRFTPTVNDIKRAIEFLIEREFLERTPNQKGKYKYVA